jgi:hypothetical protein
MTRAIAGRAGFLLALLAACGLAAAQAPRSPFDIPYPPKSPPFKFLNQHGQEVECTVSPWQRVDLGMVGPAHIYAGDHCSMPSPDPISDAYKKVFSNSCDLHDICYFAPGNTKGFCDDMLKWHTDRDCQTHYNTTLGRDQCRIASISWRKGLDTPISAQYWNRSQDWGRQHCRINPPPAIPVSWVAFPGGALPRDTVHVDAAATSAAVCRANYQGGQHPGRVSGSNCNIGYGGREWGIGGGEALVAKADKIAWTPFSGQMPPQAVVGGVEHGQGLAVCRARYQNAYLAGKVVAGNCNVGYGGKELTLRPFDVLVFRY